ncbi:glycoside hydrolase family 3 N-terminal domain-containing protein, partial [Arthrobacter sp.]
MLATLLAAASLMGSAPATAAAPASLGWSTPAQHLAHMTLQQRVGQLFMVAAGATGASQATMNVLSWDHVGNVYLAGRSSAGINATAAVVRRMTNTVSTATTDNEYLSVATDQEGGYVQVLSGPGFSTIPTALS